MSKNKADKGKWTGLVAGGAIVAAGTAIYINRQEFRDNPDIKDIKKEEFVIDNYFRKCFFSIGDADQFADVENVSMKTTASALREGGCARFMEFFKHGVLPLRISRLDDSESTIGEMVIEVEKVGDIVIPEKTYQQDAINMVLDFMREHKEELFVTDKMIDEIFIPKPEVRGNSLER